MTGSATPVDVWTVRLLAFDEVELLDFAGPYEVFTAAERVRRRDHLPGPAWRVCAVSPDGAAVRARAGAGLAVDHGLADTPPLDLLVVPGGVVDRVAADPAVAGWLRQQAERPGLQGLLSVCTGSFVLAAAGLLPPATPCTTHWEDLDALRAADPTLDVRDGPRWVATTLARPAGPLPLWTSAGIAAGIDAALAVLRHFGGEPLARRCARQMDVAYLAQPVPIPARDLA
jgi:transcriptional regulator GlxA family with amidase domain